MKNDYFKRDLDLKECGIWNICVIILTKKILNRMKNRSPGITADFNEIFSVIATHKSQILIYKLNWCLQLGSCLKEILIKPLNLAKSVLGSLKRR